MTTHDRLHSQLTQSIRTALPSLISLNNNPTTLNFRQNFDGENTIFCMPPNYTDAAPKAVSFKINPGRNLFNCRILTYFGTNLPR